MKLDLKLFLAISAGKLTTFVIKLAKLGGATAAPGLVAEKIDRQVILKLAKNLTSIIVTGTNGKTTTSRMLSTIFEKAGFKIIHNRAGSNLIRGIASTLIAKSDLRGNLSQNLGIWEVDEATLPAAVSSLKPKIVLITNLFRDQLDRYGEVDKIKRIWAAAVSKLPKTAILILDADDPALAHLGHLAKNKVIFFGINDPAFGQNPLPRFADTKYCGFCQTPLDYELVFISHLGKYSCQVCAKARPDLNLSAGEIELLQNSSKFRIFFDGKSLDLKLSQPGLYNIYNALGTATAALTKVSPKIVKAGLESFKSAFGRVEEIKIGKQKISLFLVKNPTGFNEVIRTIFANSRPKNLLIAVNDKIADGRDVSWLWDVDFEKMAGKINYLIVSGTRATDLALRLKYAGAKKPDFVTEDFAKAVKTAVGSKQNFYFLPTYTAMLEIRKILNRMGHGKKFWED